MIQPIYGNLNPNSKIKQSNNDTIKANHSKNLSFGLSYKNAVDLIDKSNLKDKGKKLLIIMLGDSFSLIKRETTSKFAYNLSQERPIAFRTKAYQDSDWFRAEGTLDAIEYFSKASLQRNKKGEKRCFNKTNAYTSELLNSAIKRVKDNEDIIENSL